MCLLRQKLPALLSRNRFSVSTYTTSSQSLAVATAAATRPRQRKIRKTLKPTSAKTSSKTSTVRRIVSKRRCSSKAANGQPLSEVRRRAHKELERQEEADPPVLLKESGGNSIQEALRSDASNHSIRTTVNPGQLQLNVIQAHRPEVPTLSNGLDRVLFNPGVCHVRDPRSRVYNFDPYLEKIMPVHEFDFDTLTMFIAPSKDEALSRLASAVGKRYIASTSSMTGVLKHFHYLLSRWRVLNLSMLSKSFPAPYSSFTKLSRAPDALFLRWKDGVYAVDADKEYDDANVLSLMGRYMERLLTVDKETFETHRVGKSETAHTNTRQTAEAYHYSSLGNFVLRSQLDAHDSRLPGTGMFDLKTRAVLPIRMDSKDFGWGMDYEIKNVRGEWESFEREYYDMIRSTMLKYSLQVRMGRMDGIFVAFHNIARIFGFQYIGIDEMDLALHGQSDRTLGDQEFMASVSIMDKIFERATKQFPNQTLRFHFEAREASEPFMYIFAEPISEETADAIQNTNRQKIEEWERGMLGKAPVQSSDADDEGKQLPGNTEQSSNDSMADFTPGKPRTPSASESRDSEILKSNDFEETNPSTTGNSEMQNVNVEQDVTSDLLPTTADAHQHETSSADRCKPSFTIDDTESPADSSFLESESESKSSSSSQGPLLGMTLRIQSKVNGNRVARPQNIMSAGDVWEIECTLDEISQPTRAWSLYQALQQRRFKELNDAKGREKENDFYKDILRRIARGGKEWRQSVEARERAEGVKNRVRMWNEGHSQSTASTPHSLRATKLAVSGGREDAYQEPATDEQVVRTWDRVVGLLHGQASRDSVPRRLLGEDWLEHVKQDRSNLKLVRRHLDSERAITTERMQITKESRAARRTASSILNRLKQQHETTEPDHRPSGSSHNETRGLPLGSLHSEQVQQTGAATG